MTRDDQARSELPGRSALRRVSLTGADDQVSLPSLAALAARYPFVEWALLYLPGKEGAPRNPTAAWRQAFFEAKLGGHSAVHLCGALAFEQLLAGALPADILQAQRLQLNINARQQDFSPEQTLEVFSRALDLGPDLILQYHGNSAKVILHFLASLQPADRGRVHVLLDESRGRGLAPTTWRVPSGLAETFAGFAGGLGPENIREALQAAEAARRPFWVDMETGLRTNDQFDLDKAEATLAAAAAWLAAAPCSIDPVAAPSVAFRHRQEQVVKQMAGAYAAFGGPAADGPAPNLAAAPGLPPELRGVKEAIREGGGFWRSCSGCHELNEGHDTGQRSEVFGCALGAGCSECGGLGAVWDTTDYDAMAQASLAAAPAPQVPFDDPRVQETYELLCDDAAPPAGEHWEGWVARRIVDKLFPAKGSAREGS